MIAHHQGAIDMGRAQQANGSYEPATALAGTIVSTQSGEIATMDQLLESVG